MNRLTRERIRQAVAEIAAPYTTANVRPNRTLRPGPENGVQRVIGLDLAKLSPGATLE